MLSGMDELSIEQFLANYPPPMQRIAESLRSLIRQAVPEAIERVRLGWRLIGFDVPDGRRHRYFAYISPEDEHVHLGFEYGVLLDDPAGLLQGAALRLRKVRYLTYRPHDLIPEPPVLELIGQAARVATMSRGQRSSLALVQDLGAGPR
jgi:hypothetical protein